MLYDYVTLPVKVNTHQIYICTLFIYFFIKTSSFLHTHTHKTFIIKACFTQSRFVPPSLDLQVCPRAKYGRSSCTFVTEVVDKPTIRIYIFFTMSLPRQMILLYISIYFSQHPCFDE